MAPIPQSFPGSTGSGVSGLPFASWATRCQGEHGKSVTFLAQPFQARALVRDESPVHLVKLPPNKRLKLAARVDYGMNSSSARRSLSAIR
jgi:hypothetical protein